MTENTFQKDFYYSSPRRHLCILYCFLFFFLWGNCTVSTVTAIFFSDNLYKALNVTKKEWILCINCYCIYVIIHECTTDSMKYTGMDKLISKSFMLHHSWKGYFLIFRVLKCLEGWRKRKSIFFGFTFIGRYLVTYFGCYIPLQKVWERPTIC